MKEQHYKNHRQVVYSYYVFTGLPILVLIGLSIKKAIYATRSERETALLLLLVGYILLTLLFRSRGFGLITQDRAIRAEEALRHFILTGKPLDSRLSLRQIIALRFASDAELPALAQQAAHENWTPDVIKRAIKQWRSDMHRV
jgi:hypothetical protein